MDDILKHLAGFEKNQNELGDRYGAEILHNAAKEIERLTARNEKLEAVLEAAKLALPHILVIDGNDTRAPLVDAIAAVQTTEQKGVRPGDLLT